MSMFDSIKNKAAEAMANEGQSDQIIEKLGDAIDQRTGGQYADKVDQAQQAADGRFGDEGQNA